MPKENKKFINLRHGWTFNRLCEELNLRADELREIIKRVGASKEDIQKYLRG